MKTTSNALIALAVIAASIATVVYVSRPSQAQGRGADVQMISFPKRAGVYWQPDQEYEEEQRLERYFSQGYELEAVIEPTEQNGRPILIFRR